MFNENVKTPEANKIPVYFKKFMTGNFERIVRRVNIKCISWWSMFLHKLSSWLRLIKSIKSAIFYIRFFPVECPAGLKPGKWPCNKEFASAVLSTLFQHCDDRIYDTWTTDQRVSEASMNAQTTYIAFGCGNSISLHIAYCKLRRATLSDVLEKLLVCLDLIRETFLRFPGN